MHSLIHSTKYCIIMFLHRTIIKDDQSIYSEDIARLYFNSSSLELAPHIFMTAADCYKDLRSTGQNQAVIVTGESGSGKTEAAKHIMTFITFVCVDHIEFLNSLKQRSFEAAEEAAQIQHDTHRKQLADVKEGNEEEEEAVTAFDMSDMKDELSVQDQVNQTFESHTALPHRATERRSRVVGGGALFHPPPPPPPRHPHMDSVASTAAVNGSCGDLNTLRDAAQNEADLREIFDDLCDEDEYLAEVFWSD
jgi:hypothetical protein